MSFHLTYGALESICQGVEVSEPLVQVLGHKAIQGSGHKRFRLLLSDGLYTTSSSILAPHLNKLINDQHLEQFTIVKVKKLVCNQVPNLPNRVVIILLELEVIMPGAQVGGKIGTPVQLGFDSAVPSAPAPGAPCPHCHRHGHPTQVGSDGPLPGTMPRAGPTPAEWQSAFGAIPAVYGPTLGLEDMSQAVRDLTGGSDESGSAESGDL